MKFSDFKVTNLQHNNGKPYSPAVTFNMEGYFNYYLVQGLLAPIQRKMTRILCGKTSKVRLSSKGHSMS